MLLQIFREWLKWHRNWDDLCHQCGKCCYIRNVTRDGQVVIHYNEPCVHLDPVTHLCRIYPERFKKCSYCGKVRLWTALFNSTLPPDCAYVETFRVWRKKKEK